MNYLAPTSATVSRLVLFIGAICLSSAAFAANDPFIGKWKFDPNKSSDAGLIIKFQDAGEGKVRSIFGDDVDTMIVDGKYHPMKNGHTVAASKVGPNKWKLLVKVNGRPLRTTIYSISKDEQTFLMNVDNYQANGPTLQQERKLKRIGGTSGLFGSWQSVSNKVTPATITEISQWQGDGYSIWTPTANDRLDFKLDGKDYGEKGPQVEEGTTASARRMDGRTLELTDKLNGKVTDRGRWKVSADSSTLTITTKYPGQSKSVVEVLERL